MMATASKTVPEAAADARELAPSPLRATRPLYWSLRRELWENRSIYLAPLGVATFVVVGLVIHGITMPSHVPAMLGTDPASPSSASSTYRVGASLMLLTWLVIGAFYCLEALHGERRDRGILFWKSLPVSDLSTVLAKASIPLLVLPLLTFAVIVVMHLAMLLLSAAVLMVQGRGVAALWRELHLFRVWSALLYAVAAISLWHAPIYGFLLLVSGWARRTAALWAVLPLVAISLLEKLTMDTWHFVSLVAYRLVGWYPEAFLVRAPESVPFRPVNSLTPGRFLSTPDLWIGLALAVVFIAAAIRLRRYREPV